MIFIEVWSPVPEVDNEVLKWKWSLCSQNKPVTAFSGGNFTSDFCHTEKYSYVLFKTTHLISCKTEIDFNVYLLMLREFQWNFHGQNVGLFCFYSPWHGLVLNVCVYESLVQRTIFSCPAVLLIFFTAINPQGMTTQGLWAFSNWDV